MLKDACMQEIVRKAYIRDGKSKRQIARELGIHRDTVTRLLKYEAGEPPRYHLSRSKDKPVVGRYLSIIEAWLEADRSAPPKQRHTAHRIWERLCEEYGFAGSERRIREVVAELRQKPKESYLPLGFEPGEMGQMDWIEDMRAEIAGEMCLVQVFGMVLNHSGDLYFEGFLRATQEAFFQGHAHSFESFGGVPHTVTYDNLKAAVQKVLQGKNRQENERFVAFRSAYLFDSRFCQPAKGNEKGRIENMVKFVERNLFTPVPRVASLQELNALLRERCLAYRQRVQARQTQSVGERLETERPLLLPLPVRPPECCRIVTVKVDKTSLVQFETNRYSVPSEYAYRILWLKAFVDRVDITDQEKVIASHPRLPGKYGESIRFEHYRKVLERKPGGLQHLRATDKEPLPEKVRQTGSVPFPKATVHPPDLSKYRQLRKTSYEPSPDSGNASEKTAAAQHAQTLPQAGG